MAQWSHSLRGHRPGATLRDKPNWEIGVNLDAMIEVGGVKKRFGATVALAGVDLTTEGGRVIALLGPNGAGKTTLVRVLTTLLRPDAGWARVAGFDVVKDATPLRSCIGLAGQSAAVDEMLTGRENLELVGRLYHLSKPERRKRAQEVLELFGLADAGDRQVRTYSGGMRRRLDVGASLVGHPPVLILDEPTTGLDPRSRLDLWQFIEGLVSDGTTILLTTQYLEEADRLAHQIVVLDQGKVIADGTSDQLKDQLGGDRIEARVTDRARFDEAVTIMSGLDEGALQIDASQRRVSAPTRSGTQTLMAAARLFDEAGIALDDLALHRPSLDDVFLALTGHVAEEVEEDAVRPPTPTRGRPGRRNA
jgi:ABC-2 type transport system ATP-binding protein